MHESLLDGEVGLTTNDKPVSDVGMNPVIESRLARKYLKLLTISARVAFFVVTHGGFILYTYISVCIWVAPFFALLTGMVLDDYMLVAASIMTLLVAAPMLELFLVLPLGIYRDSAKQQLAPMSPLYWTLKLLDIAKEKFETARCFSISVIAGVQIIVVFLIVTLVFLLNYGSQWAVWTMIVLVMAPCIVVAVNVGILAYKAWLYMIFPDKMTKDPEEPTGVRWPFVKTWEKYLDDAEANPVHFRKCGRVAFVHIVFTVLFFVLQVINVRLLMDDFDVMFLLSTILNFTMFPFLLRFNILNKFKVFKGRSFERHPNMRKIAWTMFIVRVVVNVVFVVYANNALNTTPEELTPFQSSTTYAGSPAINVSEMYWKPSICSLRIGAFDAVQYLGLASLPYDFAGGESVWKKKLELLSGSNWEDIYDVKHIEYDGPTPFGHLELKGTPVSFIVIKGTTTKQDSLFTLMMSEVYRIPERVFGMIPFASLIFAPLLDEMIVILNTPIGLYTPRNCLQTRLSPVLSYVQTLENDANREIVLVGYSTGGVIAKAIGMGHQHKALAVNSPEVRLWYLGDLSSASSQMSYINNIALEGQMYVGTEDNGLLGYIHFDDFPSKRATPPMTLCTTAIQCSLYSYFQDYCEATVDSDTLEKIIKGSSY